ncbi:chitin synthase-domain-containing protein [Paraphysoderma sedebokerense]|nr:chitin synthase-domain-containing protein [Paraphysoderma sedebokerense]
MNRYKTVRRNINLKQDNNLVYSVKVPGSIWQPHAPVTNGGVSEEFSYLRYTAATCDPNDYRNEGYTLRTAMYGRRTELYIVVTMYNEDEILFTRTMMAINANIKYMSERKGSPFYGPDGWKNIVICIVSDGRSKINKNVLNILAAMGCYQEGMVQSKFGDKDTSAHVFELSTCTMVNPKMEIVGTKQGIVPMQVIFCLKEKNQKKINSHRWFFNAFGPVLNPSVCVLIDVGTKPRKEAIYRLWKCFDENAQIGGACGEICVEYDNLLHLATPLIAAQNFEYKMSNILDKPLESVAGYISVLPGAFSAYRYEALKGAPLDAYFLGEKLHGSGGDVFSANMYLAEDRILCFELVAKKNDDWLLYYEKDSKADTDVPDNFPEFISQRRRWLNGSTFALLYALINWTRLFGSGHNFIRLLIIVLEFVYMFVNFIFGYFAVANFYLAFAFLGQGFSGAIRDPNVETPGLPKGDTAALVYDFIFGVLKPLYVLTIVACFVTSLGNRPQGSKSLYTVAIWVFSIITAVMMYFIVIATLTDLPKTAADWKNPFKSSATNDGGRTTLTLIALASTYGLYFLSSFLFLEPLHMFVCFLQYIFLLPTYVNILQIYAYCNISDVSWGTKGDSAAPSAGGATVTTSSSGEVQAQLSLPSQDESDIQMAYQAQIANLMKVKQGHENAKNQPPVKSKRDAKTKQDDYFKLFRTNWVLLWITLNGILIAFLTTNLLDPKFAKTYLVALFFSVAGLSLIRFTGAMLYLVFRALKKPLSGKGHATQAPQRA